MHDREGGSGEVLSHLLRGVDAQQAESGRQGLSGEVTYRKSRAADISIRLQDRALLVERGE